MNQAKPKMKEGQWHSIGELAECTLQERLEILSKAGGAVKAVVHCLHEVEQGNTKSDDYRFNHLSLVESPCLYDALELLGDLVMEESNDLCKRFGLTAYYRRYFHVGWCIATPRPFFKVG